MTWGVMSHKLGCIAAEKKIPILGQFELTARCNLQCKMCYVCRNALDKQAISMEKTAKEWIKIAEEAMDAGMLYLLLTGGEVFIRKDFRDIYEELSKMGFIKSIYSNGTMITPQIAKWLGSMPPAQIDITLYGGSPKTYGKVCGDESGFERALQGIDLLLAEGINVQIRTSVIKENQEDFERLAELAEKRGVDLSIVNYISPRREGFCTNPEGERLNPKDLVQYEWRVNNYYHNKMEKSKGEKQNKNSEDELDDFVAQPDDGHPFQCNNGKSSFWITWDGKMIPCSLLDDPYTLPFETGFSQAWRDMTKACSCVLTCSTCKQCSLRDYCMSCPARLKSETGSFTEPASYLCEYAREMYQLSLDNKLTGGLVNEKVHKTYFRND